MVRITFFNKVKSGFVQVYVHSWSLHHSVSKIPECDFSDPKIPSVIPFAILGITFPDTNLLLIPQKLIQHVQRYTYMFLFQNHPT